MVQNATYVYKRSRAEYVIAAGISSTYSWYHNITIYKGLQINLLYYRKGVMYCKIPWRRKQAELLISSNMYMWCLLFSIDIIGGMCPWKGNSPKPGLSYETHPTTSNYLQVWLLSLSLFLFWSSGWLSVCLSDWTPYSQLWTTLSLVQVLL